MFKGPMGVGKSQSRLFDTFPGEPGKKGGDYEEGKKCFPNDNSPKADCKRQPRFVRGKDQETRLLLGRDSTCEKAPAIRKNPPRVKKRRRGNGRRAGFFWNALGPLNLRKLEK